MGRKDTIPGRKTRRMVAPGSTADEERAARLAHSKGLPKRLSAESVVDLMVEDVLENAHVKTFRLLLKVAGVFEKRRVEQRPRRRRRMRERYFLFATEVAEFRKAVPNFTIDTEREGVADSIFDEFAKYICAEAEVLQFVRSQREGRGLSDTPRCLRFLERALAADDLAPRGQVVDCVRTLAKCEWSETIWEWAGPRVREVWP